MYCKSDHRQQIITNDQRHSLLIGSSFQLLDRFWTDSIQQYLRICSSNSSCVWLPILVLMRITVVADAPDHHTRKIVHQPRCFHLKADQIVEYSKSISLTGVFHNSISGTNVTGKHFWVGRWAVFSFQNAVNVFLTCHACVVLVYVEKVCLVKDITVKWFGMDVHVVRVVLT